MKYDWFNQNLFDIIPADAMRILDVGCDTGLLGKALKEQNPRRHVAGIEVDAEAAEQARQHLDEVHILNAEQDSIDHVEGEYDVIILGDVIEHLFDPCRALVKLRKLLAPDGELYTSIPNIQHYSIFRRLLKGDFQYRETGLLDATHVRFYCLANIDKLMLDAGFLPRLHNRIVKQDDLLEKQLQQMLTAVGLPRDNLREMATFQFQTAARKAPDVDPDASVSLSFIVHSKFTGILKDNFYASPMFRKQHPHQLMIFNRKMSLPEAWNSGVAKAQHDYVVLVKEHVYLPNDWDKRLVAALDKLKESAGDIWAAGCAGVSSDGDNTDTCGSILTPGVRYYPQQQCIRVDGLGDSVIVIKTTTAKEIGPFDAGLGEHLHGIDLALRIQERGGQSFSLFAPCLENGPHGRQAPPGLRESEQHLKQKWQSSLPIATLNGVISAD